MPLEQIPESLDRIIKTVVANRQRYQTVAANEAGFDLRRRIFNSGQATDGSGIGEYNYLPYKRYRQSRGRQVAYVDLQLDGNLFRNIQTGASGKDIVLGFVDPDQAAIAAKHEQRYGKDIFVTSEAEDEAAEQAFRKELDITIAKALR